MRQIDKISVTELKAMASKMYDPLVKVVVDVRRKKVVVDAEMHVDEEQWLLENGAQQADLWGINLYPEQFDTDQFIEYDSMINIRPRQQNRTRNIESEGVRDQVKAIIDEVVHE
jgi:hypothetical protein